MRALVQYNEINSIMMNIEAAVAQNARQLRRERHLTLEDAAQRSGISRSMISQIENGGANPTVSLLANLARAYRVTLADFLTEPEADVVAMRAADLSPEENKEAAFRICPIFPFDPVKRFEVYRGEAEAGVESHAKGHTVGSVEYVMLVEGTLAVTVAEKTTILEAGDSLRFACEGEHVYANPGKKRPVFIGLVSYGTAGRPDGAL